LSQSIDFQDIKKLILETTSLTEIISDPQYSTESLYLYWALDALENDTGAKTEIFQSNRDILKAIQKEMRDNKTIEPSLEKYSSGFILGLLEFTIRSIEANIETYDEYQKMIELLLNWKKKGFTSELIEKQYKETVKAIQEINNWHELKKEEYYPIIFQLSTVSGAQYFISELLGMVFESINYSLIFICFLFLLKIILRNQKITLAAFIIILALVAGPGSIWAYLIYLVFVAMWLFVLMRFGLVAGVITLIILALFQAFPITYDASAWYFKTGIAALAIFAAIVLYAFRTSLGGRPMFGTPRLDE